MNRNLFVLFICLMISFLSNAIELDILSSTTSTDSSSEIQVPPVTIIVNPNVKNQYSSGNCGNQNLTCNNLQDALTSFMKVATLIPGFPNKDYHMYQMVTFLLTDGTYNFNSNSISLFNMNATITTLTPNSKSVIFSGGNPLSSSPLFSITGGSSDTGNQPSYTVLNGIQFNISQPVLSVNTTSSFTDFKIYNCQFLNYFNKGSSMITINQGASQLALENNAIYFVNSTFNSISTNVTLMSLTNTIVKVQSINVSNGVLSSLIDAKYCSLDLVNGNFNGITSSNGLFVCWNSTISIGHSTFIGNYNNGVSTNIGGSVINMISNAINMYYFEISYSTFINNSAVGNGGIVCAINTLETTEIMPSYFINSSFTGSSSGGYGGVAFLVNIPLIIKGCTFGNSTSGIDGFSLYVSNTDLSVSNSTFIGADLPSSSSSSSSSVSKLGSSGTNYIFYASASNVTFQSTNIYKVSIDCEDSLILINTMESGIVGPYQLSCSGICSITMGNLTLCSPASTTISSSSTSSTSSTSGTGTGSGSNTGGIHSSFVVSSSTQTSTSESNQNSPLLVLIAIISIIFSITL